MVAFDFSHSKGKGTYLNKVDKGQQKEEMMVGSITESTTYPYKKLACLIFTGGSNACMRKESRGVFFHH